MASPRSGPGSGTDATPGGAGAPGSGAAGRAHRLGVVLEVLGRRGRVDVGELARSLEVSGATVRRDLATLEDSQLLRRTHGGAVALDLAPELPVRYRGGEHREAKRAIAREAARRIPTGTHALGLTGGSTTSEVARWLTDRTRLTVITNALNVAYELAPRQQVKVVPTGGVARSQSYELVGPWAEQTLRSVNLGTAVVGVDGISAAGGLTTHDEVEAATDAVMISRARRTVIVADASKLGRVQLARICDFDDVDELITDDAADPVEVAALRAAGLVVTVVDPGP